MWKGKIMSSVKKINIGLLMVALLFAAFAFASCGGTEIPEENSSEENLDEPPAIEYKTAEELDLKGENVVKIEMEDGSVIKAELYPDVAPKTVANFVMLVKKGFYDGLIFHRVIDGFMIQGGDPQGTGTGGSDVTIKGEFYSNGVNNLLSHTKGVLSMARSDDPDSASSQFFICVADSNYLDGQYAAFGKVIEGMDVAEKIAKVEKDANDKPLKDVMMKKVTIE
jgi:peptidyl-prolyl cis-trans isomerase B (cyclophilin B)